MNISCMPQIRRPVGLPQKDLDPFCGLSTQVVARLQLCPLGRTLCPFDATCNSI